MRRGVALTLLLACGPRPAPAPWQEREAPPGAAHVAGAERTASTAAIDVATLTPARIDALDEATALTLLERLGGGAPAGRIALRAARLAHHRGDDAEARALLARAANADDAASVRTETSALAGNLAPSTVDPKTIAVLLPLTGRYAALGRELETAIKLAPRHDTRWMVLDTRSDPTAAAALVETAARAGAVAILGPVGTRESIDAARAAALRQIPIVLLSPDDGADPAAGVFRLIHSPADEGRMVARLASTDQFPTVAVLAPRDDLGAESAAAFVEEATRLGLQVAAQGTYDPTGGDLEVDLKRFLNLIPASNPRLAAHLARHGKKGWTTFSPDIPFSLLYVPDRYDRAALVAAFLPYYGVELRTTEFPDAERLQRKHGGNIPTVVQLVGGSGWNHPSLPIRGGAAVQGSMFVDVFAAELGADLGAQFAAEFQARVGRAPSSTAAQAYDAATLVSRARQEAATAPDPRAAIRAAIARAKLDDGACGPAAMDVDGEIAREPVVLEVSGDQVVIAP